jgi:hypothetical protein
VLDPVRSQIKVLHAQGVLDFAALENVLGSIEQAATDGAVMDEHGATRVTIAQIIGLGGGVDGGVGHVAGPIGTHPRPEHAHRYEQIDIVEIGKGVTVGADGSLFTISEKSGKLMRYDAAGAGSIVVDGILGHSILAMPDHGLYVTTNAGKPREGGTVWFIKDGKKKQVDSGLTFATGMAYRPDQWLLSVADGTSKWAYSYRINADGALAHKERFFHLHVNDWQDDAGADHSSRAGQRPRDRRGHRRKRHGHAFRPLRQQDLETQDPAARQGRVEPVDAGDRHETMNRCAPPAIPST